MKKSRDTGFEVNYESGASGQIFHSLVEAFQDCKAKR
jgi:hypothetical protein